MRRVVQNNASNVALGAKADMDYWSANVRLWHLADIGLCAAHVCFWPKADIAEDHY